MSEDNYENTVKLLGIPTKTPNQQEAFVMPNKDTVLMSDVLRDQLPHINGEAIIEAEKSYYRVLYEYEYEHSSGKGFPGALVGILFEIIEDHLNNKTRVTFKTMINDAMEFRKLCYENRKEISPMSLELSRGDEEPQIIKLNDHSISGVEIAGYDYKEDLCFITIEAVLTNKPI